MALPRPSPDTSLALTILGVWLAGALAVGASGLLVSLEPPGPQLVIASLTAIALVLSLRVEPIRSWVRSLDPRWLIGFHVTRFVGLYFLVLYDRGELPRGFGLYGGLGDIAVATLAVLLLLFVPADLPAPHRHLVASWNALGFVDILAVVGAATQAFLREPTSMAPLLRLPLSLLPTFIVPLILTTHVLMFVRLRPSTRQPLQAP